MAMRVDKAGRDDKTFAIELLSSNLKRARRIDAKNPVALERNIGLESRPSGAIDDKTILENQISCVS